MHGAGCVRQWFRTAEPLEKRRYENWNTHTHKSKQKNYLTVLVTGRAVFDLPSLHRTLLDHFPSLVCNLSRSSFHHLEISVPKKRDELK